MPPVTQARLNLLEAMLDMMWERSYAAISVDAICERAGVKKGSFYHFFSSKAALAAAALEHRWDHEMKGKLEQIFAPEVPPLERLQRQMEHCYRKTVACRAEHGRVLGCPYFNIASETTGVEPELADMARGILRRFQGFLEQALREAVERGDLTLADPAASAACLFSMMEGCATQARIHDDPELVRQLSPTVGRMLGVEFPAVEAAV